MTEVRICKLEDRTIKLTHSNAGKIIYFMTNKKKFNKIKNNHLIGCKEEFNKIYLMKIIENWVYKIVSSYYKEDIEISLRNITNGDLLRYFSLSSEMRQKCPLTCFP